MALSQQFSLKLSSAILFTFSLYLSACTQGGGPGGGEQPKVTVAGTETPAQAPLDVCEKPENLNNILCQWVATEFKAPGSGSQTEIKFEYDANGRITGMVGMDSKGVISTQGTLTYTDQGLWKLVAYSDPQPPDSGNFTQEAEMTYFYDSNGSLQKITTEEKKNGAYNGEIEAVFTSNGLVKTTTEKDNTQTVTKITIDNYTKDASGRVILMDERDMMPNSPTLTKWEITKLEFDQATGRLNKMEQSDQNCAVKSCMDAVDPTKVLAAIEPTTVATTSFGHDDQGRLASYSQASDGEIDYSVNPPVIKSNPHDPPDPDHSSVCQIKYELQTQAKIAGQHPLGFMMLTLGAVGFDLGFTDRDMFTTMSCQYDGKDSGDMTFKWVRLWEALPEGKPPGGS